MWNRSSRGYDRQHAGELARADGRAWGFWRLPESSLRLLGPTRGRRTLELGCGAARWSIGLAARGAKAVGVDLSTAQLGHARRLNGRRGRRVGLVQGTVEQLPIRTGSVDAAFSDWGGLTFADPRRTIPEAARVLRKDGTLVLATSSPWRSVFESRSRTGIGRRLKRAYFGLGRIDYPGRYRQVNFQLTYGDWVELFRSHGLSVERLIETPAPSGPPSGYLSARQTAWGRSWPLETIWVLRKRTAARSVAHGRADR